jgi:hypothetical protein
MANNWANQPSFSWNRHVGACLLVLSIASFSCCGCNRHKTGLSAASARQALETGLTAWQNGEKAGKVETTSAPIQVVDADWLSGKKLEGFEILSEKADVVERYRFSVRLRFRDPQASKEVSYVVEGGSPLKVFQEQDFDRSRKWQGFKEDKKGKKDNKKW